MDENRVEGTARNFGGTVQEAVGRLAGDENGQLRGKVNQVRGQAQKAYGETVDDVREYTAAQPFVALFTAMGLGVVLGFLLGRQ